jgi:hypothetical protein
MNAIMTLHHYIDSDGRAITERRVVQEGKLPEGYTRFSGTMKFKGEVEGIPLETPAMEVPFVGVENLRQAFDSFDDVQKRMQEQFLVDAKAAVTKARIEKAGKGLLGPNGLKLTV